MSWRGKILKRTLIAAAAVLLLLFSAYGMFRLSRSRTYQVFGELVSRVETSEKVVALTFDDGPRPGYTEEILSILSEEDVKATFFLVGKDMEENPDLTKQIIDAGHEVGNHSYSHRRMVLVSPGFAREELAKTDEQLERAGCTTASQTLFRPPYGKKLLALPYVLAEQGRMSVTWDVEPETYPEVAKDPERIIEHVQKKVRPGSIVLLHVMFDKEKKTMRAVRPIIKGLREKGYRFSTVSEMRRLAADKG